jgi:tetratricopeptide (TPR) repeat protein
MTVPRSSASSNSMFCQTCGASNREQEEYCTRCHQKLLVLSGGAAEDELLEPANDESFSLDEHLLERISVLEEVVKRTAETVRQLLGALYKQEKNIVVSQTGFATLRELLERKAVLGRDEWNELWEAKMEYQLLALEKRERFLSGKDRIAALYRGGKRKLFLQHLEDAEYALFSFDVERAIAALEAAYKLDRANYELAYFLGETHFNEGAVEEALACFERVLEAKPDHYEGLIYSGVIHHQRGGAERAEALLKQAAQLYPDAFLPHFSLGAVHAARGNLAKAALYLETAVGIETVPQALYLLGSCHHEMGRNAAAVRWLEEAVRHDPAFEEAHYLLGIAYLDRHWRRKAIESFRKAQLLNPRRMQYRDLARYLAGREGFRLAEVRGEAGEAFARAEESMARGDHRRALADYRRALALQPENTTVLMSYALLCLQLDRHQEIEAVTQRVLALNPGEMLRATAYATLIEALRAEGKLREGNRVGREMLSKGTSDFSRTIAYYEMAYNLAELEEDLDEALAYARQAVALAPQELQQFPLAALGWVHYKRREFAAAVEYLTRASALEASQATLTHLGLAHLANGDEERARGAFSQARGLAQAGGAAERRMMDWMKDSTRLRERIGAQVARLPVAPTASEKQ